MNERNQAAKEASWACNALFLAIYFRTRVQLLDAVVSRIEAPTAPREGRRAVPSVQVFIPFFNVTATLRVTVTRTTRSDSILGEDADGCIAVPLAAGTRTRWGSAEVDAALQQCDIPEGDSEPGPCALPAETAEWLRRVPPAQRRQLLDEGAVRVQLPTGEGDIAVSEGAAGGSTSTLTVSRTTAAASSPPLLELRTLERVVVALYCVWDESSARRPPLIADLVADTPAVRSLMACKGGVSLPSLPKPVQSPATAPVSRGAAVAVTAPPPPSLYGVVLVAGDGVATERLAAPCGSRGGTAPVDTPSSSKRYREKATAAPPRGVEVASVTRGRSRYGGFAPPPLPLPHELELRTPDLPDGSADDAMARASGGGGGVTVLDLVSGSSGDLARAMAGAAHPMFSGGMRAAGQQSQSWGAAAAEAAAAGAERMVFGGDAGYGADRRHNVRAAPGVTYEGASAYGSRVGEGTSAAALVHSEADLGAATRAAMARAEKVRAERRNDRMDKKRRTDK